MLRKLLSLLFISITTATANTRQPDPGPINDTICTVNVFKMLDPLYPENNTLLIWPKGSCCTTIDCQLQAFKCPANPAHPNPDGKGGDICCYKETGDWG
ncbi:hypothetical protein CLAFUW4_13556 [Fulvia fulva]|uniref:Uncharacterized protein n=1 Tax=Passalora fulva TaxID=5499 RepID=A0A9Q8PKS8_PASFU|nr:uncharacterized protein CLAFUR5_13407 [Fulvia fulva]KAK4610712.1 hypothetical protein CLAFUR4_13558 [Fulvia fulva]KAK4611482.1 hypothetical protein CLAFUR0_13567 [Fulvia fulva]UJO24245.1 hypothetical protein CLAFUR5_13407 [Fulvia fulva]WPV22350.1 hypothetical protein CLAFUW4_13556 [Fulvia fulva]WPV36927.1 hypothetical protein CLAFUW7_13563 [Fulvia fulva]